MTRLVQITKGTLYDGLTCLTLFWVSLRWRLRSIRDSAKLHSLEAQVVVSLTSYPPRFETLIPTLKSLMMQRIRPDFVELWVADSDFGMLPTAVLALRNRGLTIRTCADIRSYKKIIPTLKNHPRAVIVTADDDAYYWPSWLEELLDAYKPEAKEVLCHRAHQIVLDDANRPISYRQWRFKTPDRDSSRTIFPTGVGGVLYPPGILQHPDVARGDLFTEYCPTADDIWLFWMASLNGARFRKVGPVRRVILWRGGQAVSLYNHNVVGSDANDGQIAAMIDAYGFPPAKEAL